MKRRETDMDWKEEKEREAKGKKTETYKPNPLGLSRLSKMLVLEFRYRPLVLKFVKATANANLLLIS
jgi:hypothetical protein